MSTGKQDYVWYVGYGSNLLRQRFLVYILGGMIPAGHRSNPGCNDHTLPIRDEPLDIPVGLYFSVNSAYYKGSVAFIDPDENNKTTKARAYLITLEQFWEVTMQENGWQKMPHDLPSINVLRRIGTKVLDYHEMVSDIHRCEYSRMVYLGERDKYPMFTFTTPNRYDWVGKPGAPYLSVIAKGLAESHHLTPEETADYLVHIPGIADNYTRDELKTIASSEAVQ